MEIADKNIRDCIKTVNRELESYLDKHEGLKLKRFEVLSIKIRSFSIIAFFLVKTDRGTQRIVMKKVVHDPINLSITKRENQALVEYKLLEKLYPKFQNIPGCSVPRPIMVLPKLEAFLMDFVEGTLLSNEICNARIWANNEKFASLEKYFFLCGRWLQSFQKFTDHESAGVEAFEEIIGRCDIRLKLIEESNSPLIENRIRVRTLNFLKKQISLIEDGSVMISGRHGDFGHWNILVNTFGIVVLDFLGYAKEPIPFDITKIIISLETWINDPTFSPTRINMLKQKFFEGFGSVPFIPYPVAAICEIYHRVAVIYACLSNSGSNWFERYKKKKTLKTNLKVFNNILNNNLENAKLVWPKIQKKK